MKLLRTEVHEVILRTCDKRFAVAQRTPGNTLRFRTRWVSPDFETKPEAVAWLKAWIRHGRDMSDIPLAPRVEFEGRFV